MELIFMYVDEFRHLSNIGLNFSEEIKFKFYRDSSSLEIVTGRERIEGFFGSNIINASAIVGANGTGKTTISELIYTYVGNYYLNTISIFKENKSYHILCNSKHASIKEAFDKIGLFSKLYHPDKEQDVVEINKFNYHTLYYSATFGSRGMWDKNNTNDISTVKLLIESSRAQSENVRDYQKFRVRELMSLVEVAPKLNLDAIKPIEKITNDIGVYFLSFMSVGTSQLNALYFCKFLNSKIINSEFQKVNSRNYFKSDELLPYITSFFALYTKFSDIQDKDEKSEEEIEIQKKIVRLLSTKDFGSFDTELKSLSLDIQFKGISGFHDFLKSKINSNCFYDLSIASRSDFLVTTLQIFQLKVKFGVMKELFEHYYNTISKRDYYDFHFDFSSGETALLQLFSRLYKVLQKTELQSKTVLIILDEPDVFLHPDWSRKLLSVLFQFLEENFKNKFQIITTTHSPFMLSDIPHDQVVFLKRNEGAIEILSSLDKIDKTFAQNISKLLLNSFYVEGAFVGEISKKRIKDAIEVLENGEPHGPINIKNIDTFLSLIGDPYIKGKLLELKKEND